MHILFLTHYFPPEVNAPASRTFENAKRWTASGHKVTVLTCAPNHPNGILYPGYENRLFTFETMERIRILRVKTYLSANSGFLRRILNYISYMVSAILFCRMVKHPDIVVSTSPQFFCGMAGYFVSILHRCPWVLEIRDLWPESIVAVGAIKNRHVISLLEKIESFLYKKSDHIVSVTQSFKKHISNRDIPEERISVLTNGADTDYFIPSRNKTELLHELSLDGKFIVSYIGTHGMAHGLDTLLDAAILLRNHSDIHFMLIGSGSEREKLLKKMAGEKLVNVSMLPQQPKDKVKDFITISGACIVHLKKKDLFKTVIPSKIFEAMAMERPIILGVEGESKDIIQNAGCGLCIEPENARQLSEAIMYLKEHPDEAAGLGKNGKKAVIEKYSRESISVAYAKLLSGIACTPTAR